MDRRKALFFSIALTFLAAVVFFTDRAPESPRLGDGRGLAASADRIAYEQAMREPVGPRGVPDDYRTRALERSARMPRFSTRLGREVSAGNVAAKASEWSFLGPGNVGGRTRSLVIFPRTPDVMLAGGVTGGIWKTENAGASWRPVADNLTNTNVASLVINPADPDVVFAGTGEVFTGTDRPYSRFVGAGIARSMDAGESWSLLPSTGGEEFRFVSDLSYSDDGQWLFAATISGIWRSGNNGETWTRILEPLADDGTLVQNGCTDLALIDDDGDLTLLASCGSRRRNDAYSPDDRFPWPCPGSDCEGRVYRSADPEAGATWAEVLSEPEMGRISIAAAEPGSGVVYAVGARLTPGFDRDGDGEGDYENGLHAVFRSDDNGLSWRATIRDDTPRKLQSLLLTNAVIANLVECEFDDENEFNGQGWYDLAIAVDPTNPERVWVGGIDWFRSDDGGDSWAPVSYWWLDPNSETEDFRIRYVHADQHAMIFHPRYGSALPGSQTVLVVNDGGVYRTFNALAAADQSEAAVCEPRGSGVRWESLNNGYGVTQFYHGVPFPSGDRYLGGTQDNGTILGTDASGTNGWFEVFGGDGAYSAIDPRRENVLYVSTQGVGIRKSVDGGQTFERVSDPISDAGLFIMPYVMDPRDGETLYAGTRTLWRTTDGAQTWQRAAAPFGPEFADSVSALAVSPLNLNRVLVANRKAIFQHERARAGTIATTLESTTPRLGWVSSFAFDPSDAQVAYATYVTAGGSHVWKTTDEGVTWFDLDGAGSARLPDIPVHSITVDPLVGDRLFVGSDSGIFVSLDGGYSWAREAADFARVPAEHLTIGNFSNEPHLFAFTHGRGAWRTPVSGDFTQPAIIDDPIDAATSGLWFNPDEPGHGFVTEVIETPTGNQLLVYWFVFEDGQPIWLGGVGELDGAIGRVPLISATGADFPPRFDPADVVIEPWGSATLSFEDDSTAMLSWNSTRASFGSGSMPLKRLTRIAEQADACVSGAWFNRDQNGHGLLVELSDATQPVLTVVWFVFIDGEPTWLIGSGPWDGTVGDVPMERLAGGDFPPAFDAADTTREAWGSLRFEHDGADGAVLTWASDVEGFGAGSLTLERLSSLAGHSCGG